MIDLHCHLLPGIDDGPDTLTEALNLARAVVADGITHSVLTSHIDPDRYTNQRSNLQVAAADFSQHLADAGIPLQVRLGGEARLCPELIDLLAANQVPFLGEVDGWRILLLEFPHQMIPVGSGRFIYSLQKLKIRPLIAHPERNKAVMAQPDRIEEFTDAGCWLQLTAGSLCGRFGEVAQKVAFDLIETGYHCLAATDAHNLTSRAPLLSEGRDVLRARYGDDIARQMTLARPGQIFGLPAA